MTGREGVGPQALGPKAHLVVVRLDFQRVCCLMLETDWALLCFFLNPSEPKQVYSLD